VRAGAHACWAAAALGLLALACAGPVGEAHPARVRVELARGLGAAPPPPSREPLPVFVVVDLSPGPDAGDAATARGLAAVRRAASRSLAALDAQAEIELFALWIAVGGGLCGPPVPVRPPPNGVPRLALARLVEVLEPRGRGSLGEALEAVAQSLEARAQSAAPGARVIVFSALGERCDPDPCAAAARLVALGAELDVVVLGDAPVPACLAAPPAPTRPAPGLALAPPPAEGTFRVERHTTRSGVDAGGRRETVVAPVAEGAVGGPAVEVAPGAARVVITLGDGREIEAPAVVLGAGMETRIRVLDFGEAQPQVSVDVVPPAVQSPPPGTGWD
jgi:hypothetical protein